MHFLQSVLVILTLLILDVNGVLEELSEVVHFGGYGSDLLPELYNFGIIRAFRGTVILVHLLGEV
jgi:hypothetical protein